MDVVGYSPGSTVAVRHAHRARRLVLAAGFAHAGPSLRPACAT
jgi:hypothetical protein